MGAAIAAPTAQPQIAKYGDEVKITQFMLADSAMRTRAKYRLSLGQSIYAHIQKAAHE